MLAIKFKKMEINKIYNEDNLETMARMPNDFVDLIITSPPYEDISGDLENRAEMVYYLDVEPDVEVNIIPILKSYIKDVLEENDLNDNETKLGIALIEVLDNYETIFPASDNNKFNKNVILLSLREMTNLSTKEIRASMKKYKKIYLGLIEIKPD